MANPENTHQVDLVTDTWNLEDFEELERPPKSAFNLVVFSRDWTVGTIVDQIQQGNINLEPAFQRRNAWQDARRSRLIESFIMNLPVPQIVLAENPHKRKSFIVIDGKQRLLTIAGLLLKEYRGYWKDVEFTGLELLSDLNGVDLDSFLKSEDYEAERRQLVNADIRTTIISDFKNEGILYDVFYRLNTGSVPLSSQELRQVLNRGDFARFLLQITSTANPIWKVLEIEEPDARLRDVELLLRLIAWAEFSSDYKGNLKPFLDDVMRKLNTTWPTSSDHIESLTKTIFSAVESTIAIFGSDAGKKFKNAKYESRINRALFEVQTYYMLDPDIRRRAQAKKTALTTAFKKLSSTESFSSTIEATTKSVDNYQRRFDAYRDMLKRVLGGSIPESLPFAKSQRPRT